LRWGIAVALAACCSPAVAAKTMVADSNADFTATGQQGTHNNWHHGYYNLTTDGDSTYQAGDFIPFTNSAGPAGGAVSPGGNHWTGIQWDLQGSGAPWTYLAGAGTHPNGTTSAPNHEHHTIRRWVSPYNAVLDLSWTMVRGAGGNGVEGFLYHNDVLIDTSLSPVSTARVVSDLQVKAGDTIDLALGPNGPDGSDGSTNRMTIDAELVSLGLVANSQTELSGTQGQNNWRYGYWDKTNDGDGTYTDSEFVEFFADGTTTLGPANHWNGSSWQFVAPGGATDPPWTSVTAAGGHPQGTFGWPDAQWSIRRWESEVNGTVNIAGTLNNGSSANDGTIGRIIVDGTEIYARLTNGNSFSYSILADVNVGSKVDFVIDAGLADHQGNDSTTFTAAIDEVTVVPEPSTLFLAALGLLGLLAGRRRRRR